LVIWVIVSQPTFSFQTDNSKTIHIKAENLKEQVYTIVEKFDGRSYESIEVLDKTAEYIHSEFSRYSDDVSYQTLTRSTSSHPLLRCDYRQKIL
jgi:hypothetical protein